MNTKKGIYIFLFIVLGIGVQFLIHAVLEIGYSTLLLKDFGTFGFGFSYSAWFLIHHIFTVLLLGAGIAVGFWQGLFWWKRIYEQ